MGSIEDISLLCRLCLVKDQVNIPIFDESSDIGQTLVKINSCLPVKVSRDDNLPKKICDGCSYKLDMLFDFRKTSTESEKQLVSWLSQAGLSTINSVKDPLSNAKSEITVKQEALDSTEARTDDAENGEVEDAQNYLLQQQQLPYEQDFEFGENSEMTEEPAPKRAKRAVKKAPVDEDETEDGDEDLDAAMQITKTEEEDSEEIDQPDYVEEPSTSVEDQPGPSGVGKAAVEAPSLGEEFVCERCQESFPSSKLRSQHMKQFHRSYTCVYCDETFLDKLEITAHAKTHAVNDLYHCNQCNETFYHTEYLQFARHKKFHSYSRRCSDCGHMFYGDCHREYFNHRRKHEWEKVNCEICGYLIAKPRLEEHIKTKHDITYEAPIYPCEPCGKIYRSKAGFRVHIRICHEGERYICEICGKITNKLTSLMYHMRSHTGEKPYTCKFCGKNLVTSKSLRIHTRLHTKEKPYLCNVCGKSFTQGTSLKFHMQNAHSDEEPYECTICSKKFKVKCLFTAHMKRHRDS